MTGVEAASAITKLSDIIAGAIFTTLAKRVPQNQVKAGDKYMDWALELTEKWRDILEDKDRVDIEREYDSARRLKPENKGVCTFNASRKYKRKAKDAYKLAKDVSKTRREELAFAQQVAEATVDVAEKMSIHDNALEESLKQELHENIVGAIESSEVRENPSSYDSGYVMAAAEGAWDHLTGMLGWVRGM